MSESAAIAMIVILDVALLGFLAWIMSHPRRLARHVSAGDAAAAVRPSRFTRDAETASQTPRLVGLQRQPG
jgi:hypothetical protein